MVFKKVARAFFILMLAFFGIHSSINKVSATENSEVVHSDMFEFEAYIKDTDIIDGTASFDSDDEPGNDSGPKNGIVRSWDTVTYPIKITINPKKADMLENIRLRITGTLDNGVTDGNRINAKFAVGGKESIAKEEVSFEQTYMMARTGNSVMIPVTVEVQGAKNGIELRPDIKVEVVSVNGEKIEGVVADFDDLPSVTVSSKVSIKPIIGSGLAGHGIDYYPYARINGDEDDPANMHAFAISWGITNLPGKSSIKGSTFPDPNGKINFEMSFSGHVAWDGKPNENFDFEGRDTPFELLDHRQISRTTQSIGSPNTLLAGESYAYPLSVNYGAAPVSFMTESERANSTYWRRAVWDSGDWSVDEPTRGKHKIHYTGHNTGYEIGSTFPIHRADGWSGGRAFGVNERVFSSESFLVYMPNEYRIGGPNNPDGKANNANYRVDVKMLSYTDEFGVTVPFENQRTGSRSFSERNNPSGSMSVQTTMYGFPSGAQLGTPNIGWGQVSKGDASTLIGEDVRFESAFRSQMPLYGGFTSIARWNTDAFELTPEYAQRAIDYNIGSVGYYSRTLRVIRNDRENQHVRFGVENFEINHNGNMMAWFDEFTKKGINDYIWFDSYDDAIATGKPVAAVQNDITAPVGPKWATSNRFPLKVKHNNIGVGSKTMDETANIAVTNTYAYLDEERKNEIDVTKNRAYHSPAIWDSSGNMINKQSPSGGSINFETLAVTPAESASKLTADKMTYYNSETIKWRAKNSIVLPRSGTPDDLDTGLTIEHTLPKSLDYRVGSGKIGDVDIEPELITHSNGTSTLRWRVLMSHSDRSIPDITFETSINPFALGAGVQSSVEVKGVIESELDQRPVHLRTNSHSVTVLKVGMVGIHQTIDELFGGKHSDYIIRLRPYTTVEDEYDVMGLTNMPKTGDRFGSVFQGTAELVEVGVDANRPVSIYLNNQYIESDKPHEIDYTKDGWYKYTGKEDISKAQSLLFHVEGVMKNTDDIEIAFQVQTKDNDFGDRYHNETVVNSATNYRLSPISNRVRHTIRADVEFNIERIRIYTANAKEGLPVRVRVNKVINRDRSNNERLKLVLYEYDEELKSYSKAVYEKEFTVASLEQENALSIPSQYLSPNTNRSYEARIEGYNTDRLYVLEGADRINTLGYTATETEIDYEMTSPKALTYEGVVMTERRLGFDIDTLYERIRLPMSPLDSVESGDGIEINQKLQYKNDVGFSNYTSPEFAAVLDERIFNGSYGEKLEDGTVRIHLEQGGQENSAGEMIDTYRPPHVYVEEKKGTIYSDEQYAAVKDTLDRAVVSGGNKVYVPVEIDVWGDELGQYPYRLESVTPIGVNEVRVVVRSSVEVTRLDIDSPVGEITARFDRSERDDHVDYTSNDLVDMIDSNRVTVDVTGVEDVGVSGVDFVTIEEQRRIGYGSDWMTVREIEYDWPDPYNTRSQTYDFDVSHAQDTRFVLTLTDRAGNTSNRIASNVVRHSVLQAVDFRITDVVNPNLSEEDLAAIRASDLSEGVVDLTAGTDVTFDVTYQLRYLDTVDELSGKITIKTMSDDRTHTHEIEVNEDVTGHNQNVTFTKTFTVPQGTPKGSEITIVGNLEVKLANGTTHEISYPSNADIGVIDNHIEEFFRFRIVR